MKRRHPLLRGSVLVTALLATLLPGRALAQGRTPDGRVPTDRVPSDRATRSAQPEARGDLFDAVARRLTRRLVRGEFRSERLPDLLRELRPRARAAEDLDGERAVVQALLEQVPYSHVGLLSDASHAALQDALHGRPHPSLGFQVVRLPEGDFVTRLEAGGAAEGAGLLRGDRLLSVDGAAPDRSPRLDRRTDDASLPDPPLHALLCAEGERVRVVVESSPGRPRTVDLVARATAFGPELEAGMRVEVRDGARIAYVHPWYVPAGGLASRLEDWMEDEWRDCDALVLDLRGRGGMLSEALRVLRLFDPERGRWRRPVVALVDGTTRSAKEILADELQREGGALLVGEPTAGAVVPATFDRVGPDDWLMYPTFFLGEQSRRLEGEPRVPEVEVRDRLPWAAGADPIREAGMVAASEWVAVLAGR